MEKEYVSQAEFARRCGVTRQNVNKQVREGRIAALPDGRIDAALVSKYGKNVVRPRDTSKDRSLSHRGVVSPPSVDGGVDVGLTLSTPLTAARAENISIKTEMEAIKLAKMRGELVDVQAVEKEMTTIFRDLRDQILAMPAQLAGRLVKVETEAMAQAVVENALRDLLDNVNKTFVARLDNVQ